MVPESTDRQAPSGIASSTEPELPEMTTVAGQRARGHRDHTALNGQSLPLVRLAHRGHRMAEGHHSAVRMAGPDPVMGGRAHPAVPDVVPAAPHQLHRSPCRLRDQGGLDRGIVVQPPSERAAAAHDMDPDLRLRQSDRRGDAFPRVHRCLGGEPDLGTVGTYVRHRGQHFHRGMADEGELELALDLRRSARRRAGRGNGGP
jgi:hypothetical protein